MSATLRLLQASTDVAHPMDVNVIADAVDLSAVMRQVGHHASHVLVLDLRLPNGSSIEMIRRVRKLFPGTAVVVLTLDDNPIFARRGIDAGATGFVLKDNVDTELVTAVRHASRGQEYVSPRLATGLGALQCATNGDVLTPRETEILRLIALGHTSAEIALKLHLSRRTVETHGARIYRKLGFRTRAEIVRFALQRQPDRPLTPAGAASPSNPVIGPLGISAGG
jgi:two-component system, NarL family, response regulator NreC